tara:strand:+ start:1099 stop:2331 length:1233 start_codon:yes stop_codon:yes gene_type:complete
MKLVKFFIVIFFSYALSAQDFTNYFEADGILDNSVNCVSVDADDNIWFGTNSGVSFFDGFTWVSYSTEDGLIDNSIKAIFASSDGAVWIGTDFGLSVFNESNWESFTQENGLGDNRVNHINEDSNGWIWVGEKDGLSVFNGESWTAFTTADGLPFGGINHVTFDSNDDKWLASSIFGVIHFDGTTFTTFNTNSGLINNNVRAITVDEADHKWVATGQGISVLDSDNTISNHHTMMLLLPPPDTLNPVVDIELDSNGNVWAGIYVDYLISVGGLAVWNSASWTDFDYIEGATNGLAGPVIRDLAIDSQNNVWVATSTGVTKISNVELFVSDLSKEANVEIYPNPSTSNLIVRSELEIHDFRLINSAGCEVICPSLASFNGLELDVTNLDKGLYILDLKMEQQNIKKSLLID